MDAFIYVNFNVSEILFTFFFSYGFSLGVPRPFEYCFFYQPVVQWSWCYSKKF